jgi:hypothetical protein
MIESNSLISALGLPHSDGQVKLLLQALGLQDKKVKLKRGDFDVAFDAPSHGVDVVFSDPTQHDLPETFPEGALVFSCVFFFSEGSQGHKAFQAPLPLSLRFAMPNAAVRALLGEPEWTSPVLPIEHWMVDGKQVAVSFTDDGQAIDYISVALPEL